MKRILFDADVVLDLLLDRQPYVEASAAARAVVETGIPERQCARQRSKNPHGFASRPVAGKRHHEHNRLG
jgi:hypothetical protein